MALVRAQGRELLQQCPAYLALPAQDRLLFAEQIRKIARFLADGNGLTAKCPMGFIRAERDTPAAEWISSVNFPAFVAGLLNGVFHAIVNSSIEQMQAYAELMANAAKQVDQFMADNERAADAYLVQRWPDSFDYPPLRLRAKRKSSALRLALSVLTPAQTYPRPRRATVQQVARQLLVLEKQQSLLSSLNESILEVAGIDRATAPGLQLQRVVMTQPGDYIEETTGLRAIVGIATGVAGFVGVAAKNPSDLSIARVTSFAEYEAIFGGTASALPQPNARYLPQSVAGFFANGGRVAYIAPVAVGSARAYSDADYIGASDPPRGLAALAAQDGINFIVAPGITSTSVHQAMVAQCEARHDRIAILDVPLAFSPQPLTIDSSFATAYWPWLIVNDAGDAVPPSGHLAGQYARLAAHRAPSNEAIAGATGLTQVMTQDTIEQLQSLEINSLRVVAGRQGVIPWGMRTLSSDPEWKYVAIRRYAIYIEQSLVKGLEWLIFEANGPTLWARVRVLVENFLLQHWRDGALLGTKSEQAYFVKCDRSTMTQADIDQGRLVIVMGIAPLRPSEFVIIQIGLWTTH